MGAITGTKSTITEFAGAIRLHKITCVPASASDAVTLTLADHGIRTIYGVIPQLTAGQDANLASIYASFSGLVITVVTLNAAGGNATDWANVAVTLWVIAD